MTQDNNIRLSSLDEAADFCIHTLAEFLGVKEWEQGDGSECWDGDVATTIANILRKAGILDEDDRSILPVTAAACREASAVIKDLTSLGESQAATIIKQRSELARATSIIESFAHGGPLQMFRAIDDGKAFLRLTRLDQRSAPGGIPAPKKGNTDA